MWKAGNRKESGGAEGLFPDFQISTFMVCAWWELERRNFECGKRETERKAEGRRDYFLISRFPHVWFVVGGIWERRIY
jgi:hypothetical protein